MSFESFLDFIKKMRYPMNDTFLQMMSIFVFKSRKMLKMQKYQTLFYHRMNKLFISYLLYSIAPKRPCYVPLRYIIIQKGLIPIMQFCYVTQGIDVYVITSIYVPSEIPRDLPTTASSSSEKY